MTSINVFIHGLNAGLTVWSFKEQLWRGQKQVNTIILQKKYNPEIFYHTLYQYVKSFTREAKYSILSITYVNGRDGENNL
jgi:hypothetical protein